MMSEKDSFYSRVRISWDVLAHMLNRDGLVTRFVTERDTQEMVFVAYTRTAEDVAPTLRAMRTLAAELDEAADDLEAYVKNHYAAMSAAE